MKKARLLSIGLFCILCFSLVCSVFAVSYVDLERTIIGKQIEGQYSTNILVTNLESSYEVKLFNLTDGSVCNATADSKGTATLTLPSGYRTSTFEGTYRIYDDDSTFVYSKWFEDVRGGDEYEIITPTIPTGAIYAAIALATAAIAFTVIKKKE